MSAALATHSERVKLLTATSSMVTVLLPSPHPLLNLGQTNIAASIDRSLFSSLLFLPEKERRNFS